MLAVSYGKVHWNRHGKEVCPVGVHTIKRILDTPLARENPVIEKRTEFRRKECILS